MAMEMGEKIKYFREKSGMTLEELGQKVGVGKSTVRKWEIGQIANMRRDKISKIAVALDISPAYLMGWSDNPDPNHQLTKEEMITMWKAEAEEERKKLEKENKDIADALALYNQYLSATPQIQSAIETLLKSPQQEP